MSVRLKSFPTKSRGSPLVLASAYEKQSPNFRPAGWRPLPNRRKAPLKEENYQQCCRLSFLRPPGIESIISRVSDPGPGRDRQAAYEGPAGASSLLPLGETSVRGNPG